MKRSLVLSAMLAHAADACGGFFCDQVPVDQSGENVLFASENGVVTAHVQIQYVGPAEDFAWVVPLPALPTVTLGVQEVFTQLLNRTQPRFVTNFQFDPECREADFGGEGEAEAEAEAEAASDAAASDGGSGVEIYFRGAVGPYDAAVLSADDPDALRTWLADNNYDLPPQADPLIDAYVEAGDYFVALKLLKEQDTGDLVPIVLQFAHDRPCVPIRLTAIAATPDMPVRLWVLGDARAIPTNYRHVLVDQAKIDWLSFGANYTQVVSEAADEAGSRAFVTEYAGTSALMAEALDWKGRFNLPYLATLSCAVDFIYGVQGQFPADQTLLDVLTQHVPPPPGVDPNSFYGCPDCFTDCASYPFAFDPVAATDALSTRIVEPLRQAQALFDANPVMTRLFTLLSPEEMVLDPMFGFNSDLPEVALLHEANLYEECPDGRHYFRIVLEDGREILVHPDDVLGGAGEDAPTLAELRQSLPGSERAEDLYEDQAADRVYDNGPMIEALISAHNRQVLESAPAARPAGADPLGCSCALGEAAGAFPVALLALLALALLRPRR